MAEVEVDGGQVVQVPLSVFKQLACVMPEQHALVAEASRVRIAGVVAAELQQRTAGGTKPPPCRSGG